MQTQTRTRTHTAVGSFRDANGALRDARIIISYTCPRCRQYGEATPCSRCGWTPEAQVHGTHPMAGHEDRIIAC